MHISTINIKIVNILLKIVIKEVTVVIVIIQYILLTT